MTANYSPKRACAITIPFTLKQISFMQPGLDGEMGFAIHNVH